MIDWERVQELRDEIGEADFAEVVTLFLEEVAEVVDRLRSRPDPSTFEEDLHFLKGSALNLGFAEFGALCQQGETLAADGRATEVDLAPLLRCFDASRAQVLGGLGGDIPE